MSETQFLTWFKGFVSIRTFLSGNELSTVKEMLSQVKSSTNESTSTGKQMLHG